MQDVSSKEKKYAHRNRFYKTSKNEQPHKKGGIPMANQNELQNLLNTAAKRLGTNPEALKKGAQNGDLSQLLGAVGAEMLSVLTLHIPES